MKETNENENEIKVTVSFKTVPPAGLSKVLGVSSIIYESEVMAFLDTRDSEKLIRDAAVCFVDSVCREVDLARPNTVKIKQTRTTEIEV